MTVCEEIAALFTSHGAEAYHGEPVTQLQHALQTAEAARKSGADEETIVAALLHDIGHMIGDESPSGIGVVDHDRVAAEWLRARGFSERLVRLAGGHVAAKRYLVTVNPGYHARLSETSKHTLILQGGPMTEDEAWQFAIDPLRDAMLRLRSLDEAAKDRGASPPPLEYWLPLIERHLA